VLKHPAELAHLGDSAHGAIGIVSLIETRELRVSSAWRVCNNRPRTMVQSRIAILVPWINVGQLRVEVDATFGHV
jgi:hypothetical protein